MPVSPRSDLKTVSLVLTKEQVEAIDQFARSSSTPNRMVSKAEAAREIVSAGIGVLFRVSDMQNDTSSLGASEAIPE